MPFFLGPTTRNFDSPTPVFFVLNDAPEKYLTLVDAFADDADVPGDFLALGPLLSSSTRPIFLHPDIVPQGDIMTEEAALGDFKSASTRALMGLKFGGLMEAWETGCVVGRVGQVIVAEISEAATIPGLARAMYLGHQCSQALVAEVSSASAGSSSPCYRHRPTRIIPVRIGATRSNTLRPGISCRVGSHSRR
ncbi:hypothetical protein B0H14DRAFT_3876898 [Mycena olivaceomarginata]|nr:hypothetical protein B0H14DRAFT_3876898 [Mycena olivaceomarginata]